MQITILRDESGSYANENGAKQGLVVPGSASNVLRRLFHSIRDDIRSFFSFLPSVMFEAFLAVLFSSALRSSAA